MSDEYTPSPDDFELTLDEPDVVGASSIRPQVEFLVRKLPNYGTLPDMEMATSGSIGIDLYAACDEPILLNTMGKRALVSAGIAIELPVGFEAQIRPRSGLAHKHGVTVLNSPGTIDSDYRGEIKVILVNLSTNKYVINRGDRIAQMVISEVKYKPVMHYVSSLSDTERGAGGFGHSGK